MPVQSSYAMIFNGVNQWVSLSELQSFVFILLHTLCKLSSL